MSGPLSRYFLRLRAAFILAATVAITACAMQVCRSFTDSPIELFVLTVLFALPVTAGFAWMMTLPVRRILFAVSEGLLGFRERDFGLRLVAERDDEAGEVVRRFNALGEVLRREHNDAYQKQILFLTIIEAAPMAIVLCNEAETVVVANVERARSVLRRQAPRRSGLPQGARGLAGRDGGDHSER